MVIRTECPECKFRQEEEDRGLEVMVIECARCASIYEVHIEQVTKVRLLRKELPCDEL